MLVQETHPVANFLAGVYVIVFQEADVTVHLEDGQRHFLHGSDAVLSEAFLEVVQAYVLAFHGVLHHFSVVNEDGWVAAKDFANLAVVGGDFGDRTIDSEQCDGGYGTPQEGRVRAGHRILDCVRKQKQQG